MKIVVNPEYAHLGDFISSLPTRPFPRGEVIYHGRNTIEKVTAPDGTVLVIKCYKRPTRVNQLVYSGLRWSKARRSYEYAGRFKRMGIATAEAVAYIEVAVCGVFHTGYFISRHIDLPLLADIDSYTPEQRSAILSDLAAFTAKMHSAGIMHGDYNHGNIFVRHTDLGYSFALIDINRVVFRRMDMRLSAREMRWTLPRMQLVEMAGQYAQIRGFNPDLFCGAVLMHRSLSPRDKLKKMMHAIIDPILGKPGRA